jgi:hypothetical protein
LSALPRPIHEIEQLATLGYDEVLQPIADAGGRWFVSAAGPSEFAAAPPGSCATIMVESPAAPGRRWGLVVSESGAELRGMRNLRYKLGHLEPAESAANQLFLEELRRRLACPGLGQSEALDAGEHNRASRWKGRGEKFKALGRGGKLSGGRGVWDAAAY